MLRWEYYILYVVVIFACAAPSSAQQRIYADGQQSSDAVLLVKRVTEQTYASDNDLATFSTLSVLVSVPPLIEVYQEIKFSNKPPEGSPVYACFSSPLSALNLASSPVSLQRTLNGVVKSVLYSGLDLVGILTGAYSANNMVVAKLPGVTTDFNGVKLTLNASLLASVKYHGAFYIPAPGTDNIDICNGLEKTFEIRNFVSGLTYNLYDQAVGGVLKGTATTKNITITSPPSSSTIYYLEALQVAGGYLSARIPIIVNVIPKITPLVQLAN